MNGTSYLIALDGSAESRSAAYFAWELASQTGASVVAQNVLDTPGVWRFLSYDLPGFIGSGVYMDARERVTDAMNRIAEALMLSYTSQVSSRELQFDTYIDEGDPATEIANRAKDHSLVILGFHARQGSVRRPRMFEKLAEISPCPILVVRKTPRPWSKMQICVTKDLANEQSVTGIYELAAALGLPIEVYLDSSVDEKASECFAMGGWSSAFGLRSIKPIELKDAVVNAATDSLLVVPTEAVTGTHATRYRARMRDYLEQSDRSALLLWRNPPVASAAHRIAS